MYDSKPLYAMVPERFRVGLPNVLQVVWLGCGPITVVTVRVIPHTLGVTESQIFRASLLRVLGFWHSSTGL